MNIIGSAKTCLAVAFLFLGFVAVLPAQQPAHEESRVRFASVDIFIDSGSTPLAAFQVEFSATSGTVKVVGIEGGDAGAFQAPPVYDPKAMQGDRVILAAFSTAAATSLPSGLTRVATVHIQVTGNQNPAFDLQLQAAANSEGRRITATASFSERK